MDKINKKEVIQERINISLELEEIKRREFVNFILQDPFATMDCSLVELIDSQRIMYDKQYELLMVLKRRLSNITDDDIIKFCEVLDDISLIDDNRYIETINLFGIELLSKTKESSDLDFSLVKDTLENMFSTRKKFKTKEEFYLELTEENKKYEIIFNENYQKIKRKKGVKGNK